MYGDCELCNYTAMLECYYNEETGEEIYCCENCNPNNNTQDDMDEY